MIRTTVDAAYRLRPSTTCLREGAVIYGLSGGLSELERARVNGLSSVKSRISVCPIRRSGSNGVVMDKSPVTGGLGFSVITYCLRPVKNASSLTSCGGADSPPSTAADGAQSPGTYFPTDTGSGSVRACEPQREARVGKHRCGVWCILCSVGELDLLPVSNPLMLVGGATSASGLRACSTPLMAQAPNVPPATTGQTPQPRAPLSTAATARRAVLPPLR